MTEPLRRAWYDATVDGFLVATPQAVLGSLAENSDLAVEPAQKEAWMEEIKILQTALRGLTGTLFLEFNIPRMGRRIDAVLISGTVIFVIEFKIGESEFYRADIDQVWDYALDLKNFHEGSHGAPVIPILVATEASITDPALPRRHEDLVYSPVKTNAQGLRNMS